MEIDELGLVPVEKANSKASTKKGPQGPKNEPFDLRRSTTVNGERFTFTRKAWDRLAIGDNSAKQFNTANGVVVAIMPGNSGVFLKNTKKGGKGRAFKNDELAKALDDRGITGKRFSFRTLGEKDGAKYYSLEVVNYIEKAPKAEAPQAEAQAETAAQ